MRIIGVVLCGMLAVGCKKKLDQERRDTLDFKQFTIAVPRGWNRVTDKSITVPPNAYVLVPAKPHAGFQPSIIVQQIDMGADGIKELYTANEQMCATQVQAGLMKAEKVDAGPVHVITIGEFKGCDIEVVSPTTDQSARQIAITDGTVSVSIVCNRDKKGAPEVDMTCTAIGALINRK